MTFSIRQATKNDMPRVLELINELAVFEKEPVTPQTPMGLASVSKQFTAMCAAFLIEEGKIGMTDKVSKYLPDIQIEKDGRELLVQDLIWHISGLPNKGVD